MFDVRQINVAIELWGAAFCLVGIVGTLLFAHANERYRNLFIAIFFLEFIACTGDAIAGIFRGQPGALAWAGTHAGNLSTFLAGELLVPVITRYVCERIAEANGPTYQRWCLGVDVACFCLCMFTLSGMLYTIDVQNIYHRSELFWLFSAYVAVVNGVNSMFVVLSRRKLHASTLHCLLFYALAPAASAIAQVAFYGLNIMAIVSVMGLVLIFMEMLSHSAAALAQAESDVAEARVAAMVSQIQPHFLFNALEAIQMLCRSNPARAEEAILFFSRYLRANLDSLRHTAPVPIERELEHTRTYLELERMADEERVSFVIDAPTTGFLVPALSVQVLAENAVKHGLERTREGGTVTVTTGENEDAWWVEVDDDGAGFVTSEAFDGTHVGISNTRARVAAMCNGTLEVWSKPNVGTTAIMRIPKGESA
jgi:hypothetical protein